MIQSIILYGSVLILLGISWKKDKHKTKKSLGMGKQMAKGTLPEIIGIMAIIAWVLAIIPEEMIKNVLGGDSEFLSTIYGALIGTVTIIPAFIAFPLAKQLLAQGAFLVAIASFITTLTMVGFATIPLEKKQFGMKFTILRNLYSFLAAIVIAVLMGVIL